MKAHGAPSHEPMGTDISIFDQCSRYFTWPPKMCALLPWCKVTAAKLFQTNDHIPRTLCIYIDHGSVVTHRK